MIGQSCPSLFSLQYPNSAICFLLDIGHNQITTKAHENFYVDRAKTLCLLQPPCQLAQSLPLLTQLLFTESAPLIRECPRFSFATSVPVPDQCTLRQKSLHPPIPIKCPKVTRRTELTWYWLCTQVQQPDQGSPPPSVALPPPPIRPLVRLFPKPAPLPKWVVGKNV